MMMARAMVMTTMLELTMVTMEMQTNCEGDDYDVCNVDSDEDGERRM